MRTNAVQMLAALDDAQADVRVPSASAYIRIVNSIPEAYDVLLARVNRTLLAHLGNGPEIAATRADAISIHTQVQFVRSLSFPSVSDIPSIVYLTALSCTARRRVRLSIL